MIIRDGRDQRKKEYAGRRPLLWFVDDDEFGGDPTDEAFFSLDLLPEEFVGRFLSGQDDEHSAFQQPFQLFCLSAGQIAQPNTDAAAYRSGQGLRGIGNSW